MTEYDVIIVGARIAGALTAALLGERGWHVLLLDRATFPSDTLSTHFFRSSALLAFQRAGVFDEVQAVGAPHLVDLFNDVDGHIFTEPVEGSDGYNGRGIEQGSTHAVLLADALHRWLAGEVPWEAAMADFHRARNAFAEKPYRRTCGNAADFRPMTRAALQRRGLAAAT